MGISYFLHGLFAAAAVSVLALYVVGLWTLQAAFSVVAGAYGIGLLAMFVEMLVGKFLRRYSVSLPARTVEGLLWPWLMVRSWFD